MTKTKTTGDLAKHDMKKAMARGTRHVGNMIWTAIHLDEDGVSRDVLTAALDRHGLSDAAPGAASEQAAFGRAVRIVQKRSRASTVSVEREERFGRAVLVRVNRGKGKEKTTHTFAKCWVAGDAVHFERGPIGIALDAEEYGSAVHVEAELETEYRKQRGMMDHAELGAWLVGVLSERAHAVRVRDEGVIYFVPAASCATFESVRDALREAVPRSDIPAIRVMDDAESVGAVGAGVASALDREVASVLDSLKAITSDGERKNKTLANRLVEISAIANRAYACDQILGAQREQLKKRLDAAIEQINGEMSIDAEVA